MIELLITTIADKGIENTTFTIGDVGIIAGLFLTFTTIFMVFKNRKEKRNKEEKEEVQKRFADERKKYEEDKKEQQTRFDRSMEIERKRHEDSLTRREMEVKTLTGIGNQLCQVSDSVLKIEGMLDTSRKDIILMIEHNAIQDGRIDGAWRQIDTNKDDIAKHEKNCQYIQNSKLKGVQQ